MNLVKQMDWVGLAEVVLVAWGFVLVLLVGLLVYMAAAAAKERRAAWERYIKDGDQWEKDIYWWHMRNFESRNENNSHKDLK